VSLDEISTAGTGYQSVRAAGLLLDRLDEFEKLSADKPNRIKELLRDAGVNPPDTPDLSLSSQPTATASAKRPPAPSSSSPNRRPAWRP
jgi:hypothetical protein